MARRIEQIQRNRKNRKTKESILFEFEGKNKTEEIYFRNFQKRDNPYTSVYKPVEYIMNRNKII